MPGDLTEFGTSGQTQTIDQGPGKFVSVQLANGQMGLSYWPPSGNPVGPFRSAAEVTQFVNTNLGGAYPPLRVDMTRVTGKTPDGYDLLPPGSTIQDTDSKTGAVRKEWSKGSTTGSSMDPFGPSTTGRETYGVDKSNFDLPNYEERDAKIDGYLDKINNRERITSPGATLDPVKLADKVQIQRTDPITGYTMGPLERVTAQKIAPGSKAGGASASGATATAQQAAAVLLDPAAQAADSAVRAQQMEALGYQGRLMRGEDSVAALQMARDRDRAIAAQRGMAAGARPGLTALAARNAAANTGRLQGDFAGRLAEAQLAERKEAANQYGTIANSVRGQDNQLSEFNTDATNTRSLAQGGITKDINLGNAQFGTQASIATAGNKTNASIATANNSTQASIANAANSTQIGIHDARNALEAGTTNANNALDRDWKQGQMYNDIGKYNATNAQETNLKQAGLDTDVNLANATSQNNWGVNDARIKQDNMIANMNSGADQVRNNDTATGNLLNIQSGNAQAQQGGSIKFEQVLADYGLQERRGEIEIILKQMGIDADKAMQPGIWERIVGAVVPLLVTGVNAAATGGR